MYVGTLNMKMLLYYEYLNSLQIYFLITRTKNIAILKFKYAK